MNNDWKPTEQNIGQPVKPSGDNLPYPYTTQTLKIGPSGYKLNPEKLKDAPRQILPYLFSPFSFTESFEYFDLVKPYLDIPEEPKTLDEITQELDEKIDKLIETTKWKFAYSKEGAEKNYNAKFDGIIGNFEYARKNGEFIPKLTLGSGFTVNGSYVTSNFVIKPDTIGVGYWEIKPNVQMWLKQKPNWLVRKCAKIFFDFTWKDA